MLSEEGKWRVSTLLLIPLDCLMMRIIMSAILSLHRLMLPCIPLNRDRVSITSYRSRHITLSTISFTT